MNRQICKYSIIRFQPFAETQEFANIGVVIYATASRRLDFKLLDSRQHKRITDFFYPLDREVFGLSVRVIKAEIERIKSFYKMDGRVDVDLYSELTRCREDVIRFSESRVMFCDDPVTKLEQLYEHYVQHSFANEPAYEEKMKRQLKDLLAAHYLEHAYKQAAIGDSSKYKATFPFVRKTDNKRVIKPIQFLHDEPTTLIDHGRDWLSKVEMLSRFDYVEPQNVLFAYEKKPAAQARLFDPFDEVMNMAEKLGITMIEMADSDKIVEFAGN